MSNTYLDDLFGFTGQTAVVIGGNGTLGAEIARGLARAGANVVVAGRELSRCEGVVAELRGGSRVIAAAIDVTEHATIAALLAASLREFGRVDALVNCAGANSATPYFDVSDEEWDRILAINLRATHWGCQVFGRHMVERGGGAILNIASVSAETPLSRVFAYSASKAGVLSLTRNLGREWAKAGVRVNALCPGFFPAEQNRAILDETRVADILRHTPMGRFGRPEELVGMALLLLSPRAGSFITGGTFYVDGGFTAMTI
ncbi:MAG: gluconate 5-dehydrogenase [Planctomycetota bacterium]|nr:MAG: gluconate 5-dehydrogenase [Planctomycetota bacterium]